MPEALAAAPVAAPSTALSAEPSIDALAALIPDSAMRADPGVDASDPAPAAETPADAADAARLEQPKDGEQPAEDEPAEGTEAEAAPADAIDKEALDRAEQAAKRAREGSRRYREALAVQEQQRAEVQRAAREAEQHRREAEEARRLREELTRDPYKALKNLGMTDHDLAERALREGTPEAALYELKEQLQQERAAREAFESRLQEERAAANRARVEAEFTSLADNEEAYPRLAQLSAPAQLAVAQAALMQIKANGYEVRGLTDAQVAEACEEFLAPKRASKAAPAAKSSPDAAPPAGKAPAAKPLGKSLTNSVATQRAVASRPWHDLSEDEQIAQIAASLPDPA
jgi:hypothetical protein